MMRPALGTVLRTLGHDAPGSAPSEPTLSVVNDGDGDAVTATVDGDAGATNTLYYRKVDDTGWTTGEARSGDGDIAQTGLDNNTWYQFVVVSSSGGYNSVPSEVVACYVTDSSSDPAGALSLPVYHLQTLVCASGTFQALVGVTSGTEAERIAAARAHCYRIAVDEPIPAKRPFALVTQHEDWSQESEAGGTGHAYTGSGTLYVRFEVDVADADQDDHAAAYQTFANTVGTIIAEMQALAGTAGYLSVHAVELAGPIQRSGPDERASEGDYHEAYLLVRWGV